MIKKEYYNNLNEKEKYYFQQIEYYSNEIPTMSINKLAECIYTSPASLSRLVNKLGYTGYKEFKESFKVTGTYKSNSSLKEHLDMIIESFPLVINECFIPIINDANKIFIISFGNSTGLGQELAVCLGKLNYKVIRVFDSEFIFEVETRIKANDIIIYISYSGQDIDMQQLAIKMKKNYKQLLLTSSFNPPMASHVSLIINTHTHELGFPFKSRLPLELVITLICMKLHNI